MLINFSLKVILYLLIGAGLSLPALANLSDGLPLQWEFTPPNTGQPNRREGAATRGGCLARNHKLVALVPPSGKGLTTQAYPSFFWYLPENTAQKLKFTIRNSEKIAIYTLEYILPQTVKPQIMSLTLPNFVNNQSLEIGQEYSWRLDLFCQFNDDTSVTFVENKITRVSPQANLSNTSLFNQLTAYAESGIWYDTLSSLVELRSLYPNVSEFDLAWIKLLNSVKLEDIAQESLNAELNLN
jgi:hypothetical protein